MSSILLNILNSTRLYLVFDLRVPKTLLKYSTNNFMEWLEWLAVSVKKEILMQVRKQNGSTEAFMPEKVVVSIVKSGAPYEDARSIAASLSSRSDKEMSSSDIRDFVHSQLKNRGHKSSLESWKEYEREMKQSRTESLAGRATSAQSKHLTHS